MKMIRDSFIIILVTVAIIAIPEIVLRMIYPEKMGRTANKSKSELAYRFDQHTLIALKAGIVKTFERSEENGSDKITWRTNEHGFRGAPLQQNPDTRIVVYGDSNIQARFSHVENTFPFQLQRLLREKEKKNIEVINAGVIGFGPDQSFIKLSREIDKLRPDIVIFSIFASNDFGDIIRNRIYELDQNGKLAKTAFPAEEDPALKQETSLGIKTLMPVLTIKAVKKMIKFLRSPGKRLTRSERWIEIVADAIDRENQIYKEGGPKSVTHFGDYYDLDVATNPGSDFAKIKIRLLRSIIQKAHKSAVSKGVRFVVMIQPAIVDLAHNWEFGPQDLRKKYPGYKQTNLTSIIEESCKQTGIEVVNLFKPFSNNNPVNLYFRKDDDHWNDAGQLLAAEVVADYL